MKRNKRTHIMEGGGGRSKL